MVEYNFDKVTPRENTDSVKYDLRKEYFGNAGVLPMWVADMDFETPTFIREAIQERAKHPIYGYSIMAEDYFQSIIRWMKTRHHWDIKKEWISFTPGILPAINFSVLSYTTQGEGGQGFQRMNLAAPRSIVEEACRRLKKTFTH